MHWLRSTAALSRGSPADETQWQPSQQASYDQDPDASVHANMLDCKAGKTHPAKSVLMPPGSMAVTLVPSGFTSIASDSMNPDSAYFDA